jgi:ectoine hydroxylase-related dioxygenase (phytanoyl-CoA dioxygenase family)
MTTATLSSNGHPIDTGPEALGELESANDLLGDGAALKERLDTAGYLFFKGLIEAECIQAAREEILLKYAIIGEIDGAQPLDDAVFCPNNAIDKVNLRAFSKSVRSGLAYQAVVLHPAVLDVHASILGGPAQAYDFRWPRFVRPGEACGIHCDGPYMSRGALTVYSSWIPLGNVARHEGALMILERSDAHETILADYLAADADKDGLEWLSTNPCEWREQFGTRWLTTDFEAGDVLCFGMDTVHGALDNNSKTGKCRLSSDTRYQLASEPFDERWNGENPVAHGYDKVFYPGLGNWNNADFQDEWKPIDQYGRLR